MKIIEASAGPLTNFEVLDFLRKKGESKIEDEKLSEIKNYRLQGGKDNKSDRIRHNLTPSEMKVYDYLDKTAARDQTRECVSEFLQRCKKYGFAQADILPILNIRPSKESAPVELCSIVESFFDRYENQVDEIEQTIEEVLPPRPVAKKDDEIELVPLETSKQVQAATEPQQNVTHPKPTLEG
ncbi:unnamed protein product [Rhodiola kirilowii]